MFERFTSRARHVVVLAQEEARTLQHNYIGTEHLLLGLLGEPETIAGQVLQMFGMSLPQVREEVAEKVGSGKKPPSGHIPFTPRSKKVLELALREALTLGHTYIGTEHILLGIIRQAEGPAAEIIIARAGDLGRVRAALLDALPAQRDVAGPRWLRQPQPGTAASQGKGEELRTTPAADISLNTALRLAGPRRVGSHHLLLAALSDPHSAAVRALAQLGIDLDRARDALREVDVTGTNDEPPEEAGRRQLTVRVADSELVLQVTDPTLVDLGRAAVEALGTEDARSGVIHGDLAAGFAFGTVWRSLRDALEDVRRRALAQRPGENSDSSSAPEATGEAE